MPIFKWLHRKAWQAGYAAGYAASQEQEKRSREHAYRYAADPTYRAVVDRRLRYRSALHKQGIHDTNAHEAELAARGELEADRDRLVGPLKTA